MTDQLAPNAADPPWVALDRWVGSQAAKFGKLYADDNPQTVRTLAILRRGAGKPLGFDNEVWESMATFPDILRGRGDTLSHAERAAIVALTTYAVHQQSDRHNRMHRPGTTFGRALNKLESRQDSDSEAVSRRFRQLISAQQFDTMVRHLRGLVTQLRGPDIPFDYGGLARDLYWLQIRGQGDKVRLRWSRDFYRRAASSDGHPDSTDTNSPELAPNEGQNS
ncbi:type I-E CRISPR-associated protein Cse2/CasB [Epidermidibacterium keratini]|uniref:Type I-E CRISPR-associated protein Cse2/CasB n=1 Tax=Epidermidibacterium keratini TaxID=1891644 RepID=A0A7L4YMT3_9ACTN|nr:type I-E CRISPR-associated protein Cse2/CasB [Epidermidibacterium keratini]QHC00193.1 type I-E CRISPR-associated protein Cse2/CasB [Epidermidibacterium keratini]